MNKRFIILFVFIYNVSFSQNDTALWLRLNQPITNCETVAFNSQVVIANYPVNEYDSITKILNIWKNICGYIEPIQRINILLDIQYNRFNDTLYNDYIINYIDKYKDRVSASQEDKYFEVFETNKGYFDYVYLRGRYDEWTKNIATDLLKIQKEGTSEYLLCLLFSNEIAQFDGEIKKQMYARNYLRNTIEKQRYNDSGKGITLLIASGAWLPIGKLNNYFNISPQIGFQILSPLFYSFRIGAGGALKFFTNNEPIEVLADNKLEKPKPKNGYTLQFFFLKENQINENHSFDALIGLGKEGIDTKLKKIEKNQDTTYYNIETINACFGVNIRKKVFQTRSVGLNINYHFAPYYLDKKLKTDIGYHFLTTNAVFRF